MYRLIFMDEQETIKDKIETKTNWNKVGFNLVAVCLNADDILSQLKKDLPDIIIINTNMSITCILKETETIRKEYPQVKIIFLTKDNEFYYTKGPIIVKVNMHITKPLPKILLNEILTILKYSFDYNNETTKNNALYEDKLPIIDNIFLDNKELVPIFNHEKQDKFIKLLRLNNKEEMLRYLEELFSDITCISPNIYSYTLSIFMSLIQESQDDL